MTEIPFIRWLDKQEWQRRGLAAFRKTQIPPHVTYESFISEAKAAYKACPSCQGKDVKLISYGSGTGKRTTFKWQCRSCGMEYHGSAARKGQVQTRFEHQELTMKLTESVKEFILGKVHAALLSLSVSPEAWEPIEDAVFSAALSGKLGDGSVSDVTGAAIGDMVTQLAATKAVPMPDLTTPTSDIAGGQVNLVAPISTDMLEPSGEEMSLPEPGTSEEEISSLLDEPSSEESEPTAPELEEPESIEPPLEEPSSEEGKAAETGFSEEDADPEELKKGIEVEKEHTDDEAIAKKTALDHLSEIPDYYTRLTKMEKDAKKERTKFIPGEQVLVEVDGNLFDARIVSQIGREIEVETKEHLLLTVPLTSVTSLTITEDMVSSVLQTDDIESVLDRIAVDDVLL